MAHSPLFRVHETMACVVCISMLLWYISNIIWFMLYDSRSPVRMVDDGLTSTIHTTSGGQIRNHKFVAWTGYKTSFQTMESHNINGKITHVNITKSIIFQFFIHLASFVVAILVKFLHFASPFVPNLEAESMVPELTTRDCEHSWWYLLTIKTSPTTPKM